MNGWDFYWSYCWQEGPESAEAHALGSTVTKIKSEISGMGGDVSTIPSSVSTTSALVTWLKSNDIVVPYNTASKSGSLTLGISNDNKALSSLTFGYGAALPESASRLLVGGLGHTIDGSVHGGVITGIYHQTKGEMYDIYLEGNGNWIYGINTSSTHSMGNATIGTHIQGNNNLSYNSGYATVLGVTGSLTYNASRAAVLSGFGNIDSVKSMIWNNDASWAAMTEEEKCNYIVDLWDSKGTEGGRQGARPHGIIAADTQAGIGNTVEGTNNLIYGIMLTQRGDDGDYIIRDLAPDWLNFSQYSANHAEGHMNKIIGCTIHAEGILNYGHGYLQHLEGAYNKAHNVAEHAQGAWNKSNMTSKTYGDAGNSIFTIGVGTGPQDRKNGIEMMQNGDLYIKGIGGYDGTNPTESQTVAEAFEMSASIEVIQKYI